MVDAVKRISLPSGGWWEILTRPRWKQVRRWNAEWQSKADSCLVEHALVSLTAAWSFGEPVSLEALAQRSVGDMIAILQEFRQEVVPFLQTASPKEMAQELFAVLVVGRVPSSFAEIHLMAATGWSWQTLQETPADIVQKMAVYLAVAQAIRIGSTLDFPDTEE